MNVTNLVRRLGTKIIVGAALLVLPAASFAQIIISVGIAPPVLPVYAQPICPEEGYIWTPGYWAYGPEGYFWIPGTWVLAPTPGYLWTPAYWGYENGLYLFHGGYWGPHVGFYGGINYGFGYFGHGFEGGYWDRDRFFYNRGYNNLNVNVIHNTYVRNVTVVNNYNRVSFNGGAGGVQARPLPLETQAMHERHEQPTNMQREHFQAAAQDHGQLFNANHGQPAAPAARTPQDYHNQVNQRQADGQGRGGQAARAGQQSRDTGVNNQMRTGRQTEGGTITPGERQPVQQRGNNDSNAIPNDRRQGQRGDNRTAPMQGQPRPFAQPPQAQPQQAQPQQAQPQQAQPQQRPQYHAQPQQYPPQQRPQEQQRPQAQPQQPRPAPAPQQGAPRQEAPRPNAGDRGGERGGERPRG